MELIEFHDKQSVTSDDLNFGGAAFEDSVLKRTIALTGGFDGQNSIPCDSNNLTNLQAVPNLGINVRILAGYGIDSSGELLYSAITDIPLLSFGIGNGTYTFYVKYTEVDGTTAVTDEGNTVVVETTDGLSYTMSPQITPLSAPWIPLTTMVILGGSIAPYVSAYTDLRSNNAMESTATDLGTYTHGSGSLSWETDMSKHVAGVDASGTPTATNPHGVPVLTEWEDITNKPLYLIGNLPHGNGYGKGVTTYSSHYQNYSKDDTHSSGSVRVSRWGTCSNFSIAHPTDIPNTDYAFVEGFSRAYTMSHPMRHGGATIYIDFNKPEVNNFLIDNSIDWRYRWVNIQGLYHWWKGDKTPRDEYGSGLTGAMSYYSTHIYMHEVSIGSVNPVLVLDPGDGGSVMVASFGYTNKGSGNAVEYNVSNLRGGIIVPGKLAGNPLFIYADATTGYLYGYLRNLRVTTEVQLSTGNFVLANVYPHGSLRISSSPQAEPTTTINIPNNNANEDPITSNANSKNITAGQLLTYANWINKKYPSVITNSHFSNLYQLIIIMKQLPNPKNIKQTIQINVDTTVFSFTDAVTILAQFSTFKVRTDSNYRVGLYLTEAMSASNNGTASEIVTTTQLNGVYSAPFFNYHGLFTLYWSPFVGASYYVVEECRINDLFEPSTVTSYTVISPYTSKYFDYKTIKKETTYYYRVIAYYPNGTFSLYSNTLPVKFGYRGTYNSSVTI